MLRNDVSTDEENMKAELEAKERKHLNKRPREESAAIEDDTGNLNDRKIYYLLQSSHCYPFLHRDRCHRLLDSF